MGNARSLNDTAMREEPYFFIYGQQPTCQEDVKGKLPDWCCYPLVNANSAELLAFEDGAELLIQRLDSDPFVVDLIQLKSENPFHFHYRVEMPRLFLFFMLDGQVDFHTEEGFVVSHTRAGRFYVTYNNPGTYQVLAAASNNIALIVMMDPEWVGKISKDYPHLDGLTQRFFGGKNPYELMPQCRIGSMVGRSLKEIHTYSNNNVGALNGTLRKHISLVLEHYDSLVEEKSKSAVYRAKAYFDTNFADANVNMESLAFELATTQKTLTKHFKYEFGFTPYAYLIHIRMWQAKHFMAEGSLKAVDVYWRVGYEDVKSFRTQYRKTFGGGYSDK